MSSLVDTYSGPRVSVFRHLQTNSSLRIENLIKYVEMNFKNEESLPIKQI